MSEETKTQPTFSEVMDKAAKSALRGGTAGAVAMGLNVGALMWMRTTVRFMSFVIFITGRAGFAAPGSRYPAAVWLAPSLRPAWGRGWRVCPAVAGFRRG